MPLQIPPDKMALLNRVRKLRKINEAKKKSLDNIREDYVKVNEDVYGTVNVGGAVKLSKLVSKIYKTADQEPWLEFGKIFGLPKGVEYNSSHFDQYTELHGYLDKAIQECPPDSRDEYEIIKDMDYLSIVFSAFTLKYREAKSKSHLIAKHGLNGIEAILKNTYKSRPGSKAMSATMIWSGDVDNVPCYLYGDKKVAREDELASFGVVYDPKTTYVVQGEFFALNTFGKPEEGRVAKLGSRYKYTPAQGSEITNTAVSKYPAKQAMYRTITYRDGSKERFALTDHSRWSSRDKTWYAGDDPRELRRIFADNVFWRYRRFPGEKFPEQFASKQEYEFQTGRLAKERGAQRMNGKGLAQYNEALIMPKDPDDTSKMPEAIFMNLSVSKKVGVEQIDHLTHLLKEYPNLQFYIYDNNKRSNIMQQFDREVVIKFFEKSMPYLYSPDPDSPMKTAFLKIDKNTIGHLERFNNERMAQINKYCVDKLSKIKFDYDLNIDPYGHVLIKKSKYLHSETHQNWDKYVIKVERPKSKYYFLKRPDGMLEYIINKNDNEPLKGSTISTINGNDNNLVLELITAISNEIERKELESSLGSNYASIDDNHAAASYTHPSFGRHTSSPPSRQYLDEEANEKLAATLDSFNQYHENIILENVSLRYEVTSANKADQEHKVTITRHNQVESYTFFLDNTNKKFYSLDGSKNIRELVENIDSIFKEARQLEEQSAILRSPPPPIPSQVSSLSPQPQVPIKPVTAATATSTRHDPHRRSRKLPKTPPVASAAPASNAAASAQPNPADNATATIPNPPRRRRALPTKPTVTTAAPAVADTVAPAATISPPIPRPRTSPPVAPPTPRPRTSPAPNTKTPPPVAPRNKSPSRS